ncbi:MAG TPA: twin-arginine translocation signal domain-containing protein, partial [Candidatus Acidoferrum sp.]|nr:twin-arginine translocation signal domain-containing protein [Candidatus Acidoferrum sp.]
MRKSTRRHFLKSSAAAAALSTFHPKNLLAATEKNLSTDPLRPQFHLLPAKNWMNDPNGPIFWRGHYHM